MGYPEEEQEALLDLIDQAALAFSNKVYLRIAKNLLKEGLFPEKIKRTTGCDVDVLTATIH